MSVLKGDACMDMKTPARKMSLMMGSSMSLTLSMIGMISANAFTLPRFLLSFAVSFAISFMITSLVPIPKITAAPAEKLGLAPGSLARRALEALLSDLMLTPLMTFVMVYMAYTRAVSHGARIPFGPMILRSEIISIIAAFILIFFLSPVFLKIAFGDNPPGKRPE